MHLAAFRYRIEEIKNKLQVCCIRSDLLIELQLNFTKMMSDSFSCTSEMCAYLLQTREDAASHRLSLDKTAHNDPTLYTVQNFIGKIMEQCQTVYSKHFLKLPEEFIEDSVYRGLVWEMVELQVSTASGQACQKQLQIKISSPPCDFSLLNHASLCRILHFPNWMSGLKTKPPASSNIAIALNYELSIAVASLIRHICL